MMKFPTLNPPQNMNESAAPSAPQWAVIELMGHIRYGGLVCKDNQFGTAMLRIDVPQTDGSFVSQLVNPASIYRITMCEEEIARADDSQSGSLPMGQWHLANFIKRFFPERARSLDEKQPVD